MIKKRILKKNHVRIIENGFGFIPHAFIKKGFLQTLSSKEIALYFFLILVADKHGLSFYSYDSICNLIGFDISDYIEARDTLKEKDLISFENNIYQVLSLPDKPINIIRDDPALIRHSIIQSLKGEKRC